jgi:hypothetical protein
MAGLVVSRAAFARRAPSASNAGVATIELYVVAA